MNSILDTQLWRIETLEVNSPNDFPNCYELEIVFSEKMLENARKWLEGMRESYSNYDETYQSELKRHLAEKRIFLQEISLVLELGGDAGLKKIVLFGHHILEYVGEGKFVAKVYHSHHFVVLLSIFRKWTFQVDAFAKLGNRGTTVR